LARGDLGTSIVTRSPIMRDLGHFIPATVELFVPSLILAVTVGLGLGVAAAVYRGGWIDQISRVLSLIGLSMPIFWLGLILQLVFFRALGWFPAGGRLDGILLPPPTVTGLYTVDALLAGQGDVFLSAVRHLVLPAVALSTLTLGIVARMTRSSLLDTLSSNYVRTARSKGLLERTVIWRHALRSALLPVLTVVGLRIGQMFGGAVLTETVFSWPGVGRYAFVGLRQLDFPVVMGFAVWATLIYSVVNLLVDLSYSLADPRVRLE
jgi:peptide/nickel transport system permease protein